MDIKTKRKSLHAYISFITAFFIMLTSMAAFPLKAEASAEKIAQLSINKQYFRRTIGSYARANMYKYDVLASLMTAQAILESRWGTSPLATTSNNLFGMTVGSWKGKVSYDGNICKDYDDAVLFRQASKDYLWRVYDSWFESMEDYGTLVGTSSLYEEVRGVKDYKTACKNIAKKYAPETDPLNADYADKLIALIEDYDLTEFDNAEPNEYGVIALTMTDAKIEMNKGATYQLSANIVGTTTQPLIWESSNNIIAEVSQDGIVTAKFAGTTLITATIGDKEACCIVTVKGNAVTTDYIKIRESHSVSSEELGKFLSGTQIMVTGDAVHTDDVNYPDWYPVTGFTEKDELVSGWCYAGYISILKTEEPIQVKNIAFHRYELNRDVNRTYQMKYAVAPCDAEDQTLIWTSSDPSVASVEDGLITTHNYGTAVITATALSGVSKSCVVYVTDKTVKYKAMAVTELRVRPEDNTLKSEIGRFATGTILTVTDNYYIDGRPISDDFYYAEGVMSNGNMGAGFSTAHYIFLMERLETADPDPGNGDPETPEEPEDPENPENPGQPVTGVIPNDYPFDDSALVAKDGYLYGVPLSSTVGALLERLSGAEASVYDADGNLLSAHDFVTTGCTLEIKSENALLRAVVVIKGDVDGSGELDSFDMLLVKRAIIGTHTLDGPYLMAALVADGSELSSLDFLLMKRHFIGSYTIEQTPNDN